MCHLFSCAQSTSFLSRHKVFKSLGRRRSRAFVDFRTSSSRERTAESVPVLDQPGPGFFLSVMEYRQYLEKEYSFIVTSPLRAAEQLLLLCGCQEPRDQNCFRATSPVFRILFLIMQIQTTAPRQDI